MSIATAALGEHFAGTPPSIAMATIQPRALAIDIGSAFTRLWMPDRAVLQVPTRGGRPDGPVQRGRITDAAELEALLTRMVQSHDRPLPTGAVLVACRPVLASSQHEDTARQVLTKVFSPSRILFLDTVKAAAIGAAAPAGPVLIADAGAEVTQVAVLAEGRVAAARRTDLGMSDLIRPTAVDPVAQIIAESVSGLHADLRADPRLHRHAEALRRSALLLVGGGAAQPELAVSTGGALGRAVWSSTSPQLTAVHGAALAALAALRHVGAKTG